MKKRLLKSWWVLLVAGAVACGSEPPKKNNTGNNQNNINNVNNSNNANNSNNGNNSNNANNENNTNNTNQTNNTNNCECPSVEQPFCDTGTFVSQVCDLETCEISEVRENCNASNLGCDAAVGCVDLCENIMCQPPAPGCDGNTQVAYEMGVCDPTDGTCSAGTEVRTDCEQTDRVCDAGQCVDLCANEACIPPAASCAGDILTSYSGAGMCQFLDGTCDYAAVEQTTNCAAQNQTCENGACVNRPFVSPGAGDLVITEVMNNPAAVMDNVGEWFEILNVTNQVLRLNGVEVGQIVMDPMTGLFVYQRDFFIDRPNQDILIQPGQYFVIGAEDNMAVNGGIMVDFRSSAVALSNSDDELIIRNGQVEIDRIDWFEATWGDPTGDSMQFGDNFDPVLTNNNDFTVWCISATMLPSGDSGTPGAANENCP